jgi:pyrroloquinoline quinone (PQQ) biosynthesis protein C
LQNYAVQYKPFVEAFPRFVSALHSHCEDETARLEILENLMDEEGKTGRSARRIRSSGAISWPGSAQRRTAKRTAKPR